MSPLALLSLQIVSTFVVLWIFASFVVSPRLRVLPREDALRPLLWVHTARYAPLALLAPGQTARDAPLHAVQTIAWGDFISAVLAVAALVALHHRRERGLGWVWAFSIVSSVDIVVALTVGLGSGIFEHSLGVAWYVLTFYVPLVCVSQAMILKVLVRQPAAQAARHRSHRCASLADG